MTIEICNFCGQTKDQVESMVTSRGLYICNECVDSSQDIMKRNRHKLNSLDKESSFEEVNDFYRNKIQKIKKEIIGQDQLVSKLSFFEKKITQYNGNNKPNLFISGDTGTGKTFSVEKFFKSSPINFVKFNASTLTPSGYRGNNIDDLIRKISYSQANNDYPTVVYLDEIDKLILKKADLSGDLFSELLAFIEGDEGDVSYHSNNKNSDLEFGTFDLSNVFFIFSGAFQGHNIKSKVDLISKFPNTVGIQEFAGRITSFTHTNPIDKDLMIKILKSEKGSLMKLVNSLKNNGITLEVNDKFLNKVYNLMNNSIFGARILNEFVEKIEYIIFENNLSDDFKSNFDHTILDNIDIISMFNNKGSDKNSQISLISNNNYEIPESQPFCYSKKSK